MKPLMTFLAVTMLCGTADAQLFRRLAQPRTTTFGKCGNPGCPMCYPENFRNGRYIGNQYGASAATLTNPSVSCNSSASRQTSRKPRQSSSALQAPSPRAALELFLECCPLNSSSVLYDLGCGDGRVLVEACEQFGCVGVGIEIDSALADRARSRVYRAGLSVRDVRIVTGDALEYEYAGATHVYLYQTAELLAKLVPRIPKDVMICSVMHQLPVAEQTRIERGGVVIYVRKP